MRLYYAPPSPNSRTVLATACHLGVELEPVIVEGVARAAEQFHTRAGVLDAHLAGRPFLTGDISLADFSVAANLTCARQAAAPLERCEHIAAWWERLEKVEAWRQAAP